MPPQRLPLPLLTMASTRCSATVAVATVREDGEADVVASVAATAAVEDTAVMVMVAAVAVVDRVVAACAAAHDGEVTSPRASRPCPNACHCHYQHSDLLPVPSMCRRSPHLMALIVAFVDAFSITKIPGWRWLI